MPKNRRIRLRAQNPTPAPISSTFPVGKSPRKVASSADQYVPYKHWIVRLVNRFFRLLWGWHRTQPKYRSTYRPRKPMPLKRWFLMILESTLITLAGEANGFLEWRKRLCANMAHWTCSARGCVRQHGDGYPMHVHLADKGIVSGALNGLTPLTQASRRRRNWG